jgi:M6 family metalloprotease-like protein
MTTRSIASRALLLAAAALAAGEARAQDIEMAARAAGRTLPPAYYERVRQDPGFFEFRRAWTQRVPRAQQDGVALDIFPTEGEMRMAVIMTLFADSPEPPFDTETTHQQLFGENPLGNLTDFYREISGGRASVTGTVFPWVRTSVTLADAVGNSMGLGPDNRLGDYFVSALSQVDATTDFGQYDNDGWDGVPNSGDDDGYVDLAVFQFTEVASSCGGQGPWPHKSVVQNRTGNPFHTDDLRPDGSPVLIDDYIIQSAVNCDGTPQTIATIAHETGHAFGQPDFYHAVNGLLPSQRRWVLGCWTLMAAGAWGCGDGSTFGHSLKPPHMGAYEKMTLGWVRPILVDSLEGGFFKLDPVQQSGQVLRIPLAGRTEFLLVEYRPNTGYDSQLPVGGVLVYHVDQRRPFRPCPTCPRIYHINLVEADGDGALVRTAQEGGDRGAPGDVFRGSTILTDRTTPSLRLNNGSPSNLAIHIIAAGGQAQVQIFRRGEFPSDRVLGPLLENGADPLSAEEQAVLDALGNGNGVYDLGDVRASLREPAAPAPEPGG